MGPVIGLVGDHPTHAATRVGYIAGATWDYVQMDVWHRLTSERAVIDTNIVVGSFWIDTPGRQDAYGHRPKVGLLVGCHAPEQTDMPLG